jgi:hypothetical protein
MNIRSISLILGLSVLLPLAGCADVNAPGVDEETKVSESASALTYNNRYDVRTITNGVAGPDQWGAAQAALLSSWGMPFGIDEYCSSNPTYSSCIPSAGSPRPALIRVKLSDAGTFGGYIKVRDWNEYTNVAPANAGKSVNCKRLDLENPSKANNWFCYTGYGAPGYSVAVHAKYGR